MLIRAHHFSERAARFKSAYAGAIPGLIPAYFKAVPARDKPSILAHRWAGWCFYRPIQGRCGYPRAENHTVAVAGSLR